jgi:hypothetical protein
VKLPAGDRVVEVTRTSGARAKARAGEGDDPEGPGESEEGAGDREQIELLS